MTVTNMKTSKLSSNYKVLAFIFLALRFPPTMSNIR